MRTAKRVVGMDADLLYDDLVFRTLREVLPADTRVRCTVYTETRPAMQRQSWPAGQGGVVPRAQADAQRG
jgi:hypothetical protein